MAMIVCQDIVISFLLVIRNECGYVRECIQNILDQTLDKTAYEIIVVDGMSTDGSRKIIKEIIGSNPKSSVALLDNPKLLLASVWNVGVHAARGEFVIRIDAHAGIPNDFLEQNLRVLREHPQATAVGGVIQTIGRGFWGQAIAAALSCPFGVGGSRFRIGGSPCQTDTAVFALYRRETLLKIGGFDERLRRNQDVACHSRIKAQGGTFYFDPAIKSTYFCRTSIPSLAKQMYLNGHWLPLLSKHDIGKVFALRYFVPMSFVISLLGLATLSVWFGWAGWLLMAMMAVYFAAAMKFAFVPRPHLHIAQKAVLPLIFLTMHLAYGSGWLTGLLRLPFYRPKPFAR